MMGRAFRQANDCQPRTVLKEAPLSETRAHPVAAAKAAPAPPPHAQVIQMALGLIVSRALYAVAELGVADHLQHGSKSADEIAEATGAHAPSVYRLMRTLAGMGFFVEDDAHRFSAIPLGATLQTGAPGYARSTVRALAGPMAWGAWGEFLHAVRTGDPAMDKAFGQPIFE